MKSRRAFLAACSVSALRPQDRNPEMFGNAEAYERFMGRWSRLAAPLLVDFAGIPNQGRVLDIGSGTGSLSIEVAARKGAHHVTGIDPSREYTAFAINRNPFPGRIDFQVGDAQDLQFEDAAFAACLSLLVFNFIPDPGKALREARRVVNPGGTVSAAVWDYGGRMLMLRAFWDAAVMLDKAAGKLDEKHMPLCRAGELSRLWRRNGLQDVHEQALDFTMAFRSFADYWDPFLLGQGPAGAYLRGLDDGHVRSLRRAAVQRLSLSSERDPFTLPARVWAVRGTTPKHG